MSARKRRKITRWLRETARIIDKEYEQYHDIANFSYEAELDEA